MISTISNRQRPEQVSLVTSIKRKVIYSFRFTIFFIMRLVYYVMYEYGIWPTPPPPVTISTLSDDYIKLQTSKFLASYEKPSQDSFNSNIEQCFYDTKLHALAVEEADNELEKTWKRRIMFENTPRGNVIMYYDAFKQGFVYYSDMSNMPYFLINAVVMKYVVLYKCRDFFIDNQLTPEHKHSPLLDIANKKDAPASDLPVEKPKETPALKSTAFAKLKHYNTVSGKLISTNDQSDQLDKKEPEKSDEKKYTRNKIIHSGKISNFNFLQKPKVVKHVAFSSDLLDGLKANSDVQNQVFSYKDFKKLKEKQMGSGTGTGGEAR